MHEGSTQEGLQGVSIHVVLESLDPVDLHHRHPDPVVELEPIVAVDEDLVEGELPAPAYSLDHGSGLVAEAAAAPGVHPDGVHGIAMLAGKSGPLRSGTTCVDGTARPRTGAAGRPRAPPVAPSGRPNGIRGPLPALRRARIRARPAGDRATDPRPGRGP